MRWLTICGLLVLGFALLGVGLCTYHLIDYWFDPSIGISEKLVEHADRYLAVFGL